MEPIDSPSKPTPAEANRITRRKFIQCAVLGSTLPLLSADTGLDRAVEQRRVLEESIERDYNVQLSTLKESQTMQTFLGIDDVTRITEKPWDINRLSMYKKFLDVLPRSYYDNGNQPYDFVLLPRYNTAFINDESMTQIGLGSETFVAGYNRLLKRKDYRGPFATLVHELAHLHQKEFFNNEDPFINQAMEGQYSEKREGYIEKLNGVLNEYMKRQIEIVKQHGDEYFEHFSEIDRDNQYFLENLRYGLRDPNSPLSGISGSDPDFPSEFTPVLATFYVEGKKWFYDHMNQIFENEVTNNLYNMLKERYFDGKEYERSPVSDLA